MSVKDWFLKIKEKWENTGYTCDFCDREAFDYPQPRLCEDCQKSLIKNDKNTCEKCGRATVTQGVCLTCKSVAMGFDKGSSPFVYYGETAGVINRFKGGKAHLAITFAEYMAEAFTRLGVQADAVTFVPLEKAKRRARGYDQAELLAKKVAKLLGVPLLPTLTCLGKKGAQKELSVAERRDNVEGIYRVTERKAVKDKQILLIDDIMTTGATGSECASRLKRAGAKGVYFLTIASLPERK